jgi:hypothetical protein
MMAVLMEKNRGRKSCYTVTLLVKFCGSLYSGTGVKWRSPAFLVRYRTETTDAGIPMPALVFRMPMPTFDKK